MTMMMVNGDDGDDSDDDTYIMYQDPLVMVV